jgi:hypothetical protein
MANDWNHTVCHASGRDDVGADFGWNPFKAVRSVGKAIGGGVASVGKQLDKVPVVGKGLHAVYSVTTGPIALTSHIAAGDNISKAALHSFKEQISATKEIAPYAQMVVSVVPGVGQGVAGAIGAASALANGKPLNEALVSGIKGALPGGPLAAAAFDVAMAAAQGKPIDQIAISALPVSDQQKKLITQGLALAKDVASGKRVDKALLARGMDALPPTYAKVLQTGIAVGHAKNLQDAMKIGASKAVPELAKMAGAKINLDPVLKAGMATLPEGAKKGFEVGVGMVSHKFNPTELHAIRSRLTPKAKEGFDIALSTHVGKLTKQLPANLDPKVKFGYYASSGMKNAKTANQVAMKKVLAKDPKVTHGMVGAKQTIEKEHNLKHLGFLQRLKYAFTGR